MRVFRFLIPIFFLASPTAALAQGASPSPPQSAEQMVPSPPSPADHQKRLDDLFSRLKREPDATKAEQIANEIQAEWLQSGSATLDLLMQRSAQAASQKNIAAALDLLDQAIALFPDFPEAWNRRATIRYGEDRYDLSIADVQATLKREPRHFGAMMGLAVMEEELGRNRSALETYSRILAIYPAFKDAQDAALRLADELAGERA